MIPFEKACEQYGWTFEYHTTADHRYQLIVCVSVNGYIVSVKDLVWRYYPKSKYKELRQSHFNSYLVFDLGTAFDLIVNTAQETNNNIDAGIYYCLTSH
jgi:hypothetical protein